mgnify:FL=1
MAERFAKPKRFTAKWWSYFWEYYKWYVIVIGCILLAVIYTIVQIANQPKYLFNVTYAGSSFFSEDTVSALEDKLAEGMSDEPNDGVLLSQLTFDNSETADAQYQSAMIYKLQIEFTTDETMLFLFDKEKLSEVTTADSTKDIWLPVSEWAQSETPDKEGEYGVCLKDSKIINDLGIDGGNLYVAVRLNYESSKDDPDAIKRFEYSKAAANKLIEK